MKVLSVKQPWAELIASGRKTLEVRSWTTSHRGPLLIAACAAPDAARCDALGVTPNQLGCAVRVVQLVDIRRGTRADRKSAFVDPTGQFVWVLSNPKRVCDVPLRGRLGLWEVSDLAHWST